MLKAYKATLDGDRLEWEAGKRPYLRSGAKVIVTILDEPSPPVIPPSNPTAVAEALDKIAKMGGIHSFGDPLEWQRDVRKDRPLPGRDDE